VPLSSEYPIFVIDWPEHRVPVAATENGDDTVEPLTGEVTVTLVVVPFTTVILTLVVHDAPETPQDFTCRIWLPVEVAMLVEIDEPLTIVVVPLSSE
jgi:hypothetical protein